MAFNLVGRSLLALKDFTEEEILYLIKLSEQFKALKMTGTPHKYLEGKNIVLLFEKTSTRTRSAFEVAGFDLGMGVTFLDKDSSQMGKKESIEDTAKVLGRFYDGIEYRGYGEDMVESLSKYSGVPVWNGLTDKWHPTQMIADMLTIKEYFGKLKGLNLTFMGDSGNNVGNSLAIVCAKLGINFTAGAPKDLWPTEDVIDLAKEFAKVHGSRVEFTDDPKKAAEGADIIYTDIRVSMGEPADIWKQRLEKLFPYQVNEKLIELAHEDVIFMHCLPSFHDLNTDTAKEINQEFGDKYDIKDGMEVTNTVFTSRRSKVFDEAENRMHSIKAIMYATLS